MAAFYERITIGKPCRECHLSGRAFQQVADLTGASAREIVKGLPDRKLNFEPVE